VQLDRVGRDACLAVVKVEEGDAGDTSAGAEPDAPPRRGDLSPVERCRLRVAARRGRLSDHVIGASLEDEMEVAVLLRTHERHGGGDDVAVTLEGRPRRRQQVRSRAGDEEADRRAASAEQCRSVLQRFHRPALNSAGAETRPMLPAPDDPDDPDDDDEAELPLSQTATPP